jgi:capsid protein
MSILDNWRRSRVRAAKRRDIREKKQDAILNLEVQQAGIMESISSDYRGITSRSIFGAQNTGSDWNTDKENVLTGFDALERRIKQSRVLVRENPFARSAITNLQHYVVGEAGLQFHLNDSSKKSSADKTAEIFQRWSQSVDFIGMQNEILRRLVRDGAVYLRQFDNAQFRFIEPLDIKPPSTSDTDSEKDWGIKVAPDDVEVREGYWVVEVAGEDPVFVKAEEIMHLNWKDADRNVLRASPVLYDFIEFLDGAAGIIRNMRALIRVQTSIAIIREHPEGISGTQIASWATNRSEQITDGDTGRTVRQEKMEPGQALDVRHGAKIHFPAAQMHVEKMVAGLQAELRAVAAALGLPEFIFTASADSNYAGLMAAEGPAVKTFEATQGFLGNFLIEIFWRVMLVGATTGLKLSTPDGQEEAFKFPSKVLKMTVNVKGPNVKSREQFSEARTAAIYAGLGVISPQQVAGSLGLDYNEMQRQIEEHNANHPDFVWPPQLNEDDDDEADGQKTGSEKRNAGGGTGGKSTDAGK